MFSVYDVVKQKVVAVISSRGHSGIIAAQCLAESARSVLLRVATVRLHGARAVLPMQGVEAFAFPLMFTLAWGLFSVNFCYCLCREGPVGDTRIWRKLYKGI